MIKCVRVNPYDGLSGRYPKLALVNARKDNTAIKITARTILRNVTEWSKDIGVYGRNINKEDKEAILDTKAYEVINSNVSFDKIVALYYMTHCDSIFAVTNKIIIWSIDGSSDYDAKEIFYEMTKEINE